MRDDAVLRRALPLDRGLGPSHVGYFVFAVLELKTRTMIHFTEDHDTQ